MMSQCTGGILRIVAHLSVGFETAVGTKILVAPQKPTIFSYCLKLCLNEAERRENIVVKYRGLYCIYLFQLKKIENFSVFYYILNFFKTNFNIFIKKFPPK